MLSRYTLRLLTIQQFRRALRVVTACEHLSVRGRWPHRVASVRMYRPSGSYLGWYTVRHRVWVGGGVSPQPPRRRQDSRCQPGVSLVSGRHRAAAWRPGTTERSSLDAVHGTGAGTGVPCLPGIAHAVAHAGLPPGDHVLHFVFQSVQGIGAPSAAALSRQPFVVLTMPRLHPHPQVTYYTLTVMFSTVERASRRSTCGGAR